MKRVVVGFSGGVDSTAAALLLREQGYAVSLVTLDTVGDTEFLARTVAAASRIGLPHRIISVRETFQREVINYFTSSYLHGETPAPCTRCNVLIKWKTLYEIAQEEGCDHIVTGHYFRLHREADLCYVRTAVDPIKDQSYYLWEVPQAYLHMTLTPMGELLKSSVKEEYGSEVAEQESMGVCFLRGVGYGDFLRANGTPITPGQIVDIQGRVVGHHQGTPLYTIGQKRGLEFDGNATSASGPTSTLTTSTTSDKTGKGKVVLGIDVATNRLTVGDDAALYHRTLVIRNVHTVSMDRLLTSPCVKVKIRGLGRNPDGYAHVKLLPGSHENIRLQVTLEHPCWAAATGQPTVFYEDELVLGGGYLENYN